MRQLLFACDDIKRSKIYYLRFLIQAVAVTLLLALCVSQLFSLSSFLRKFELFDDLSETYLARDNTEDDVFSELGNAGDYREKELALYEYIRSLDGVELVGVSDAMGFCFDSFEPKGVAFNEGSEGGRFYDFIRVDNRFAELFGLKTTQGRLFAEDEYTSRGTLIPALVGANYAKACRVGDVLDGTYEVVGILEDKAFYLSPGQTNEVLFLRDTLITPLVIDAETDELELCNVLGFGTYLTRDASLLKKVEEKAKEYGVFDEMIFRSYTEQLEWIRKETAIMAALEASLAGIVLFFCLICVITSLLNYIDAHRREFAVHLLCGATVRGLTARLVLPVLAAFLLAVLCAALLFHEIRTVLALLAFAALVTAGTAILPALRLRRQAVSDFLRQTE